MLKTFAALAFACSMTSPVLAARSVLDPRPFAGGAWNDAFRSFVEFAATPAGARVMGEASPWREVPAAMLQDDDTRGLAAVSPVLYELSEALKKGEADGRSIGRAMLNVASLPEPEQRTLFERLEAWRKAAETPVLAEYDRPRALLTEIEGRLSAGETLEDDAFELQIMRRAFAHPGFALYGEKSAEFAKGILDRATRLHARWLTAKHGVPLQ